MKKLKDILKESNVQIGKVYSNPYATAFVKENEEQEEPQTELSEEQKKTFLEAVKQYKKYGEAVYRNAGLGEVYEAIKNMVETAGKVTISETDDWFDNVTVSRHMKRMGESFKVFEKTLKEVSTLQQRLEASYDEIGEVLGKYYEISEELDPIGKEDGDIDNDGDEDASDEYLANRRKVISKAMKNESMKLTDMISVNEAQKINPASGSELGESSVTEAGDFAGWVALYNGKRLEIKKSEANGIYGAKQIAIKKLKVPKSKQGLLAIKPAVEESVNESKKVFSVNPNAIGKAKYSIDFHDGKSTNKDGSPFIGIDIAKTKADLQSKIQKYKSNGFKMVRNVLSSVTESVNEDTKKRFDVDFYKGNSDRQTSHEEIIRGDKFSDIVSQATKVAKSKGMNYVEFYYKDSFIGSIDKRNGYEFKKGRDSEKSPLSINEAKYDIGMARMGNGITVYNRAEEERGDYKNIAHISDNGVVKYYDKKLPKDVKKKIEAEAQKMKESVNEETDKKTLELIHIGLGKPNSMPNPVNVYNKWKSIQRKHKLNDKALGDYLTTYFKKDYELARKFYTSESVNESKSMKLTSVLKESFGMGELPSSKLMKMKVSANKMLDSVNEMQVVNKKTGKDITKHLLDLLSGKIDRKEFEKLTGLKKESKSMKLTSMLKEGTRSQVGYIDNNGNIKSAYVHFDGYPENMKPGIKKHMKSEKDVKTLIKRGGARGIFDDKDIEYYDDKSAKPMSGNLEDIEKYIKDSDFKGGAEFVYLYNTKDKKWYFADTYKDKKLKKLY